MELFTIPDRVGDLTGSAFAVTIMNLPPGEAREQAILQQFELGNVPDFMRTPMEVSTVVGGRTVKVSVLPDVLCIGTDEDFLRVPMWPATLQKIADLFGASLITPYLSDLIWKSADVVIDPTRVLMPPTAEMASTRWFVEQNAKIEKERAGRTGSIAGHKKDIVLANSLLNFPEAVAIYGWHKRSGVPIQGLNPSIGIAPNHVHNKKYVDYSHSGRLGSDIVYVDNNLWTFGDVAADPVLSAGVNGNAGVLKFLRYAV